MGKPFGQLIVICLFLCWNGISHSQELAEKFLSDYFVNYDDFYQEFALAYRGEIFSVRKKSGQEKERLMLIEGLIAESVSRNIRYAAWKRSEPVGSEIPSTMEELSIGGKLFSKQYGTIGNNSEIVANNWGVPSDNVPTPKIIPYIQPHGLALLRDTELFGRGSEMRKCVPMFLRHLQLVEEIDLAKGGVRGVWRNSIKSYPFQVTIDFSQDEYHLPSKVVSETVGNARAKCTTITTWQKDGDLHVPRKIEISSQLGEGTTEVLLQFVFLKKERFEKEIKEIKPDFADAKGTAWIDRFTGWFDNLP